MVPALRVRIFQVLREQTFPVLVRTVRLPVLRVPEPLQARLLEFQDFRVVIQLQAHQDSAVRPVVMAEALQALVDSLVFPVASLVFRVASLAFPVVVPVMLLLLNRSH